MYSSVAVPGRVYDNVINIDQTGTKASTFEQIWLVTLIKPTAHIDIQFFIVEFFSPFESIKLDELL